MPMMISCRADGLAASTGLAAMAPRTRLNSRARSRAPTARASRDNHWTDSGCARNVSSFANRANSWWPKPAPELRTAFRTQKSPVSSPGDPDQCGKSPLPFHFSQTQGHLEPDPDFLVLGQVRHFPEQGAGTIHAGFGQSNGVDPDTGFRIPQTPQQLPFPEGTETLQGPERMHPGQGTRTLPQEPPQEGRCRPVLAFADQPVGRRPPPASVVLQMGDQLPGRRLAQTGRRRRYESWGRQAIDASPVASAGEIQVLHHPSGNMGRLDQFPGHVQKVDGSIRRIDRIDGPEPGVGGPDEFRVLTLPPLGAGS